MSTRTAARLVAVGLAFETAMLSAGATFFVLNRGTGRTNSIFSFADLFQSVAPSIAFLAAGAVLAARRSTNPLGWLCLVLGLLASLAWSVTQYAGYAVLTHPGSLPGGVGIVVATQGGFTVLVLLLVLIVCLFPDGRLLSRRWRVVPATTAAALVALYGVTLTGPASSPFEDVHNPWRVTGSPIVAVVLIVALLAALGGAIGAFAGIVLRFHRARGDERAQVKWLALVASTLPVCLIAHTVADWLDPGLDATIEFVFSTCVLAIPIAIGVAVLKYRLYEIDRVISRTLVYGALSLILGAAYAGLVVAGQAVFASFAGGSSLAIAVSTLAVAGLFLPVRRRLQRVVDRRFYRRRYDAELTLEAFGARLREHLELDVLQAELAAVVRTTMEPEGASVWLRAAGRTP
jgi:hypothetical protein